MGGHLFVAAKGREEIVEEAEAGDVETKREGEGEGAEDGGHEGDEREEEEEAAGEVEAN